MHFSTIIGVNSDTYRVIRYISFVKLGVTRIRRKENADFVNGSSA